MSLTPHLSSPNSPVRAWFDRRLPDSTSVVREANHLMRGPRQIPDGRVVALTRPTVAPLTSRARNPALAGTALDLLVRCTIAPGALRGSVAEVGAGTIAVGPGPPPAMGLEQQAMGRIEQLQPWATELDNDHWRAVAALTLLLARFEQAWRSMEARIYAIDRVRGVEPTMEAYGSALVDRHDLDDVATLAPHVAEDHADLRMGRKLVFGPTFGLSSALGGADADFIADGLLLDLKATSTTKILTRGTLLQVVGYALADTDDGYAITTVGISGLRWRRRWTHDLGALVARLSEDEQRSEVAELRAEFSDVVRADSNDDE